MFRRGYEVREMKLNKLLTQKLAVETAFWEREKKKSYWLCSGKASNENQA